MTRLASLLSSSRRSGLAFIALLVAACGALALSSPLAPAPSPAASGASRAAEAEALASPTPAPVRPAATLDERIDDLINRWQAGQAFWGIAVLDLESGRTIYERNAEKAFLPASNQKIVTAATALDALGAIYRYETTLRFDGTTEGDVMRGDLILDGSGDPTFGSVEVGGNDPLRAWAEELADLGVKRIEGRVIGDDDRFDDRPYPEGWDVDYITKQAGRYMGTSAGGLSYNDNVVSVRVDGLTNPLPKWAACASTPPAPAPRRRCACGRAAPSKSKTKPSPAGAGAAPPCRSTASSKPTSSCSPGRSPARTAAR